MKIRYINTIILDQGCQNIAYLKKLTGPSFLIGKYNFIGGKVNSEETHEQAAVREIKEEAFIEVEEKHLVNIAYLDNEEWSLKTFVICVENEKFAQIKQMEAEEIFKGNLEAVKQDALANPQLYSPDFMYFIDALEGNLFNFSR